MSLTGTPAASAVRAASLGKRIDERPILQGINLEIPTGRFVAILGANGAGKSTLLKVLATLTPPDTGELVLLGRPVRSDAAALRARIGLIGHQPMLYRDLSARENLEFFGKLYGLRHPTQRAMHLLETVGLSDRANDAVKTFSRGMIQRVAIARALMHDPELILADEPFAGLDSPSTQSVEALLGLLHSQGRTIVLVNHDVVQSLRLVQHAVVLHRGRIVMDESTRGLWPATVLAEVSRP